MSNSIRQGGNKMKKVNALMRRVLSFCMVAMLAVGMLVVPSEKSISRDICKSEHSGRQECGSSGNGLCTEQTG